MKKRRLKKKYRILLNKLEILLFLLLIFLVFKSLLTKEEPTKKQILKINTDTIYLTIDETYTLTPKVKVVYNVTNPEIISIKNNTVTALKDGNTKIEVTYKEEKEVIDVVVTNLYTLPKINNKKPYLTCNLYTAEEESILDSSLKFKINSSGYKTRAGVVTSARFLTLQFKNRISYFYENGRLVNYGDQDYADGEGRYYHEGLYLTENKFKTIKASVNGPAAWGCPLYVDLFEREEKNGLDCSGFVSWALLNGGFDVGDVGAGIDPERTDDLDDLGKKMKVNESDFDPSKIKVGDLFSRYGHIGILIGKDNDTFYIAEALDYDLHVLTMTSKEILESEWLYVILMDDLYKKDGNLKEMW